MENEVRSEVKEDAWWELSWLGLNDLVVSLGSSSSDGSGRRLALGRCAEVEIEEKLSGL